MALWLHREVFVTCQTGIQIKGLDYLFKVKNVEDLQYILAGEPTKQKKLACFCYYTLCKSMFPRERMNKNHTPWTFKGWAMALHLWWMFHGAGALTVILKVVSFLVLMTLSSIVSGWDRLIILLKQAARRWIITKLWKINLQYSEFIFATNKKDIKYPAIVGAYLYCSSNVWNLQNTINLMWESIKCIWKDHSGYNDKLWVCVYSSTC